MFVFHGNGPGALEGTGMHITWTMYCEYLDHEGYYDEVLFDTQFSSATADALELLSLFTVLYLKGDESICKLGVDKSEVLAIGKLLLNPSVPDLVNNGHNIEIEIA
jgi:hypothetical protein